MRTLAYCLAASQTIDVQTFLLQFLRNNAPTLSPEGVFTDGFTKDEAHITSVFPNARHLLCAFHLFQQDVVKMMNRRCQNTYEVGIIFSRMRWSKSDEALDACWAELEVASPAMAE